MQKGLQGLQEVEVYSEIIEVCLWVGSMQISAIALLSGRANGSGPVTKGLDIERDMGIPKLLIQLEYLTTLHVFKPSWAHCIIKVNVCI